MSHTNKILQYLKTGKAITAWEAAKKFDCLRLSARIYDIKRLLRQSRYALKKAIKRRNNSNYAMYWLERTK